MKKTANHSLLVFSILLLGGFLTQAQAQDYATAVSFEKTPIVMNKNFNTFVAPKATPVSFPGGTEAWNQYLKDNLVYPLKAKDSDMEGKVVASFWVSPTGQPEFIEIKESLGYGCDEEVKRLIQESPRWNPARQGNQTVKTHLVVTVQFALK